MDDQVAILENKARELRTNAQSANAQINIYFELIRIEEILMHMD